MSYSALFSGSKTGGFPIHVLPSQSYIIHVRVSPPGVPVAPLLKGCSESIVLIHLLLLHHLTKNMQSVRGAVPSASTELYLAWEVIPEVRHMAMAGSMAARDEERPWRNTREPEPPLLLLCLS